MHSRLHLLIAVLWICGCICQWPPCDPGWAHKSEVYVNHVAGSRLGSGDIDSPLLDLNDWGDRLCGPIDGDVTPQVIVHVTGDTISDLALTPHLINHASVLILGLRANTSLSGILSTWQDRDPSTKTDASLSWAGLPVSWTASDAVGRFLALPALGPAVSVIVGKDLGGVAALTCGAFDLDAAVPVDVGATSTAFQGYDVPKIASQKILIAPSGDGILMLENLELGGPANLHNIEIKGDAQVAFFGSRLFGVDNYNTYLASPFGCYIEGWRNYGRDQLGSDVLGSNGGAYLNVHENASSDVIDHVVALGTVSVQNSASLLVEGDISTWAPFDGIQNAGGSVDVWGSFWAHDATHAVLNNGGGSAMRYGDAAKIGSTGTPPGHLFYSAGAVADTLPLGGIVQR